MPVRRLHALAMGILLAALAPIPSAHAAGDDAGTGADAPPLAALTAATAVPGSYTGTLRVGSGDVEDAFRAPMSACNGGVWISLASLDRGVRVRVYRDGVGIYDSTILGGDQRLGLGFRGAGDYAIQFEPTDPLQTRYAFSLRSLHDDAGTACDAPAGTDALSTSIKSFMGELLAFASDTEDHYLLHQPCSGVRVEIAPTYSWLRASLGVGEEDVAAAGEPLVLRAVGGEDHSLRLRRTLPWDFTQYQVTWSRLQNDAGSGCDAPAAGLPVSSRWEGRLDPDVGDPLDVYGLTDSACALREVHLYVADGDVVFEAADERGVLVPRSPMHGPMNARWAIVSAGLRIEVSGDAEDDPGIYEVVVTKLASLPAAACSAGTAGVAIPR